MIADLSKLWRRCQPTDDDRYSWQTWLISMHCWQNRFHFLSVSNGPTSILPDIVITLQKSHEIIFVGVFLKNHNYLREMFLRRLRDVTEKTFFLDMLETSKRRLIKDILLRCFWEVLKTSQSDIFLRCIWDVSKTLQKSHLFWDISKGSLRCLSQWRFDLNLSEKSDSGWGRRKIDFGVEF